MNVQVCNIKFINFFPLMPQMPSFHFFFDLIHKEHPNQLIMQGCFWLVFHNYPFTFEFFFPLFTILSWQIPFHASTFVYIIH